MTRRTRCPHPMPRPPRPRRRRRLDAGHYRVSIVYQQVEATAGGGPFVQRATWTGRDRLRGLGVVLGVGAMFFGGPLLGGIRRDIPWLAVVGAVGWCGYAIVYWILRARAAG